MAQDKGILKNLMVGLIYPAVLGTIMFDLVKDSMNVILSPSKWLAYLSVLHIYKIALVISSLIFYSCDYIYTIYTTIYRKKYFTYDFIILFVLIMTFNKINLHNNDKYPNFELILLYYFIFIILYYLWDHFEYKHLKNETKEKKFYRLMVIWEIFYGFAFSILAIYSHLYKTQDGEPSSIYTSIISTFTIFSSTLIFVYLITQKKEIYDQTE